LWSTELATGKSEPAVSDSEPFGFDLSPEDSELALVDTKGRIYDPKIGRFLTPDPLVQDPLRNESLNRYSYAWNNPLKWTDPSGFQDQSDSEDGGDSETPPPSSCPNCNPPGPDSNSLGISSTYVQSNDWAGTTELPIESVSDNGVFQAGPSGGQTQLSNVVGTVTRAANAVSDFAGRWVESAMDPRLQAWINPMGTFNSIAIGSLLELGRGRLWGDPKKLPVIIQSWTFKTTRTLHVELFPNNLMR
jgi:RHS repeat-associated protein